MSKLKKGYRIEKEFCNLLQLRYGFVTDRAERSMRFIPVSKPPKFCPTCKKMISFPITKKHDTFGCFDIIAKHPDYRDYTFYFQVMSNQWKGPAERKLMQDFPAGDNDLVVQVRKRDRMPWEYRLLINGEWVNYEEQMLFSKLNSNEPVPLEQF